MGIWHEVLLEVELENLKDVGQLPGAAVSQRRVHVSHQARPVVVQSTQIEPVVAPQLLAELESGCPNGRSAGDNLVLESIAHLNAGRIQKHQDALTQQPGIKVFANHQLRALRLTRQLSDVLRTEEHISIEAIVAEKTPGELDHFGHLLQRYDGIAVRVNLLVGDPSLTGTFRRQHGDLSEPCPHVHNAERRPVQFWHSVPSLHDFLKCLLDGFSESFETLFVPKPKEKPAGTSNPLELLGDLLLQLEANAGAAVGGSDLDFVALGNLKRRRQPLVCVPIVVAVDGCTIPQLLGSVIQGDVGRQRHFVPKDYAV
mmetsp:Transcript_47775/g.111842  ORF Transcript_47775/g.111842 Transcript_47775/m.111842 type:complete len:314 (+) Transcript_47775:638-1579(+)